MSLDIGKVGDTSTQEIESKSALFGWAQELQEAMVQKHPQLFFAYCCALAKHGALHQLQHLVSNWGVPINADKMTSVACVRAWLRCEEDIAHGHQTCSKIKFRSDVQGKLVHDWYSIMDYATHGKRDHRSTLYECQSWHLDDQPKIDV